MGLFSSTKKSAPSSKKIRPTVVRTQNVAKELLNVAKTYDIKAESLDFNILEVQTYSRLNKDKGEAEWEECESDNLAELNNQDMLLNQNFQIKQVYEIEIFSKSSHEDPFSEFHVAIGANATKCKVYLIIREGSHVSFFPNFEQEFINLVNKSKIRAGILIYLFDSMQEDAISKVTSFVRVNENAVYEKNETLLVAEGLEPTPTTNDQLILHYDKKDEHLNENERINYASRDFIKSVSENELLIQYIKAKEGAPGRNCRGEYLKPKDPEINNEPTFTIDETIKQVDEEDSIKYRAAESGYIALDGNVYTIKSDMDIAEISFKATGNINTGLDSEVSLNVKENDALKDAVGKGMEVEVSEIEIEGNVGSHAKVSALRASIAGQTHKTALVNAKKLSINVHKGTAIGEDINITRLEHGKVQGDVVDITQAIGGEVNAKDITINFCGSYVKATASRKIEIMKLQGTENTFIIDPLMQKSQQEGLKANEGEIAELEVSVKNLKTEIEKISMIVKRDTPSFNEVKKKLIHYKKNNIKMPGAFVTKYKQFLKVQEHLDEIQKEYKTKNDKLLLLTTKTASFQDNIFNARIINRDRWTDHNEIIFRLVDPPVELSYKPTEGSPEKIFGIVEVDDGEYEIQAVKE